jgi:hypothetical protein
VVVAFFYGTICLDLVRLGFDLVRLWASLRLKTFFGYYRLPLVTTGYHWLLFATIRGRGVTRAFDREGVKRRVWWPGRFKNWSEDGSSPPA